MPCRAAKGLKCDFPIWFTQCGRVWFTLAMPCSDHAALLKATAQHGRLSTAVLCCGLEKNGMVGAWHDMASVNQTRPYCVNEMGKTHCKPLAAQHGRGTAWARHAMCESAFKGTTITHFWPEWTTQNMMPVDQRTVALAIIYWDVSLNNLKMQSVVCDAMLSLGKQLLTFRRTAMS